MKKLLSEISIAYMNVLMKNTEIAQKVQAKGKEGKSYAICTIKDDGTVILGETSFKFWNQLVGCQVKLPFESWALAVWDALVNLSKGNNKDALEKGLSVEIARKAQREEEYDWVVERLHECFVHVCNNKSGGAPSAGGRDDKGSSMTGRTVIYGDNAQELTINVNADGFRRTIRLPDATGRAFLNFKLGVVDVEAERV
jgi:hypothetical protein